MSSFNKKLAFVIVAILLVAISFPFAIFHFLNTTGKSVSEGAVETMDNFSKWSSGE